MIQPEYFVPDGVSLVQVDTLIVVPFVPGMLREATMEAVKESGQAWLTAPIDPQDAYAYAGYFRDWWEYDFDLIVIEQDIVPMPEQINALAAHPADWVTVPYHVGQGRYATGLGFCRISRALRRRHPHAGINASLDPRDTRNLVNWISLNESVERHLHRLGERQSVCDGTVEHLHYPVPAHA